uniref:Uncharacterized protein n=1 Tax=Noctiluca scintillans TaxID=2966 RepID=A0A7S0ZMP3_NOCSC
MRVLFTSALFCVSSCYSLRADHWGQSKIREYSFDNFVEEFSRDYVRGSDEWAKREALFMQKKHEVLAHNEKGTWMKGTTKFMDYTLAEYKQVLGYKPRGRRSNIGLVSSTAKVTHSGEMPAQYESVQTNSVLGNIVRDQGSCGSCWAEAAAECLEGFLEANADLMSQLASGVHGPPMLSSQALVSCTPNPQHCGGAGGCDGATAELAFDLVMDKGIPLEHDWPYTSGQGQTPSCGPNRFTGPVLKITDYVVLTNDFNAVIEALNTQQAPLAVGTAADGWSLYWSGIFTEDAWEVNHAVLLTGYKMATDTEPGYWRIKNSWGGDWGEEGFMRIDMKTNESIHCGIDTAAHEGIACDGDPDTVEVCGTGGILYDVSYPTGLYLSS